MTASMSTAPAHPPGLHPSVFLSHQLNHSFSHSHNSSPFALRTSRSASPHAQRAFETSSDRRGDGIDLDCGVARRELIATGSKEGGSIGRGSYRREGREERSVGANFAPAASSRRPSAGPAFFPSFEDFVPAISKASTRADNCAQGWSKAGRPQGLGIQWDDDGADSGSSRFSFSPFDCSPISSSFTFHPCPSFGSLDSPPSPPSLAPDSYAPPTGTNAFSLPLTPPRSRTSSLSHFLTPQAPNTTLPPSPPHGRLPLLDSLPPSFVPSASRSPPNPHKNIEQPYPLSAADTASIAALHGGRIPLLGQLAPVEVGANDAATPIINTGNSGPMIVQAGDWKCVECGFQNWRRRKICMRCFPFANDIGSMLTIKSQRASTLATEPSQLPSTYFSPTYSYTPPRPLFHSSFPTSTSYALTSTTSHALPTTNSHAFPAPFSHVTTFAPPLAEMTNLVEHGFLPKYFEKKHWGTKGEGMRGEGGMQREGGKGGVVIFPAMGAGR